MSLKLYTYPNNPRAWKALIAAQYVGVEVDCPAFEFGKDNKTPEFKKKNPCGKVPTLETPEGCLFESNAIARYVARQGESNLLGSNAYEASLVDQWLDFASGEIGLPAAAWLYPIFGIVPQNVQATKQAKGDIRAALGVLNEHLSTKTFLVGERLTLADICVAMSVYSLYKMVLDSGFRKAFQNTNRWFLTCVNQPQFRAVIGDFTMCEKMMVAPKNAPAPKPAAEKPKPKPQQEQQAQPKKKKEENPLDLLPKSSFDLEEWKRVYSNEKDTRGKAMPWLWENLDTEGWSLWLCNYKYQEENTKLFMTNNLIGGFLQRLDRLRKYGFGVVLIFGEEPKLEVGGAWLFRGQEVPAEMLEAPGADTYEFTKVDLSDAAQKKAVEDYFCWEGDFGGNRPAFHDEGKIFK